MDTRTDCNDHQHLRTNDHLFCAWLSIEGIIEPNFLGTPCQRCCVQDAVYWNHDDEFGELLYCASCRAEVYEPFLKSDYKRVRLYSSGR
jgi:hypothetical protein